MYVDSESFRLPTFYIGSGELSVGIFARISVVVGGNPYWAIIGVYGAVEDFELAYDLIIESAQRVIRQQALKQA